MSDKTGILSFDEALNKHKRLLTESLVNFDEGKRVRKIILDIDSNSSDYEYYFQSGAASRQDEVSKLQTEIDELKSVITKQQIQMLQIQQSCSGCDYRDLLIDELQKRVKELELINFDSELHFDAAKEHIDNLQKRIDVALDHAINHGGYNDLTHIINILKGEETK